MKSFKEFNDVQNNLLFEMANLSSKQTGIDGGYIFISTRMASHGCRIKFIPNLNDSNKCMVVSIPKLIITDDSLGKLISNKKRKEVVKFAKVFANELLNFWNKGTTWDDETVTEFKSLLKLPHDDLVNLNDITLRTK